jgi:hypothetical protein
VIKGKSLQREISNFKAKKKNRRNSAKDEKELQAPNMPKYRKRFSSHKRNYSKKKII